MVTGIAGAPTATVLLAGTTNGAPVQGPICRFALLLAQPARSVGTPGVRPAPSAVTRMAKGWGLVTRSCSWRWTPGASPTTGPASPMRNCLTLLPGADGG